MIESTRILRNLSEFLSPTVQTGGADIKQIDNVHFQTTRSNSPMFFFHSHWGFIYKGKNVKNLKINALYITNE